VALHTEQQRMKLLPYEARVVDQEQDPEAVIRERFQSIGKLFFQGRDYLQRQADPAPKGRKQLILSYSGT